MDFLRGSVAMGEDYLHQENQGSVGTVYMYSTA